MKDYLVIYEQADDGAWGAYSPDINGVIALGRTRDEAASRMREALVAHIAALRDGGLKVPEPTHRAEYIGA